jgi:hypothetical protein
MTLSQLEQAAEDSAWYHLDIRGHLPSVNGYATAHTRFGRLTLQHRKGDAPKRGQRSYFINGFRVSRSHFAALLEG